MKQAILGIRARMITAMRRRKDEAAGKPNGFTLVELLVVLAILGLVAAVATPQVLKYLAKAKTDTARIDIKGIGVALDLFLLDIGHYPTEQEGLAILVEKPNGGGEPVFCHRMLAHGWRSMTISPSPTARSAA